MTNEAELRKEISLIVKQIVVSMRKDRTIPVEQILVLNDRLDQLKVFTKGQEMISKSLAFELFYLYTRFDSQMSYTKETNSSIVAELYMKITSVFNDGLYQ